MGSEMERELEVALHCAVAAARVCEQVQESLVGEGSITKSDRSPVTVADFGSQAVVCRILKEAFPEDPIVAEETSEDLRMAGNERLLGQVTGYVKTILPEATDERVCDWIDLGTKEIAPRYWCLDPIDGTKGFLRKDQYAVALALVENGEVKLGLLACPNLSHNLARPEGPRGVMFFAILGQGAYQTGLSGGNAVPVHVSPAGVGDAIRFCESFESGHSDHDAHSLVARRLGIIAPSIRMDSQAKYGIVARGDASIYLRIPNPKTPDYREKVWDHAAGSIIIQEAGGKVTDIHGKPLDFGRGYLLIHNSGVVATNGLIHREVLEALCI
jgi:3'(2'), 5'-bisphosphate nucleotidase